jgi:transcriptional regulator with XRE-family HTH domain
MTDRRAGAANGLVADLGHNIRVARKGQNVSLRELARRVGISASALSQIETGKTRPTVRTAYEIARQLGVRLADLSVEVSSAGGARFHAATDHRLLPVGPGDVVLDGLVAHMRQAVELIPREAQQVVELDGGERFRVLSGRSLPGASCLLLTYEPGAVSPPGEEFVRHAGHEFN